MDEYAILFVSQSQSCKYSNNVTVKHKTHVGVSEAVTG